MNWEGALRYMYEHPNSEVLETQTQTRMRVDRQDGLQIYEHRLGDTDPPDWWQLSPNLLQARGKTYGEFSKGKYEQHEPFLSEKIGVAVKAFSEDRDKVNALVLAIIEYIESETDLRYARKEALLGVAARVGRLAELAGDKPSMVITDTNYVRRNK